MEEHEAKKKDTPEEKQKTIVEEGVHEEGKTLQLSGMYQSWFLEYASYAILDRAIPGIDDGLKPVQRRILHAMQELDDGRYNKVANLVGHTMKYHPHGDHSIGDAMVQLGQKEILIDTQGNWGNILTGDNAAAPRYIEARLSPFAREVVFNPKTTCWMKSYDGRNREPVALPVKFPLLLAQGVEGIAVGLISRILPHNFIELLDASIKHLRNEPFELYPDFPTGGFGDFSKYNDGIRGGKVRVRAKINKVDKKTLAITEIPYSTNTSSLIDSILSANDKGKIKIKKIDDNTAASVEILIHLAPNVSPDKTIDALYAFTHCEVSISPYACVIRDQKPCFMGVSEILRYNTAHTVALLKQELMIRKKELLEQILFSSLVKIFIENRIYRHIEKCTTWEAVLETIDKGLDPFKPSFYREITQDDLVKLTEIRIKRISKYDTLKADEQRRGYEEELKEVNHHLENLVDYAIEWYQHIREKYGKGNERKTVMRDFDNIEATRVAANNAKLYVNREDGFIGTSLKKDEFVCDCSDIDDIIVFHGNGTFKVVKVADKVYVGDHIIHIDVFHKNDDRTVYNMIYADGRGGNIYVKRFSVLGITREKEYDLTKGKAGSRVLYFTANPNGEAEIIKVSLRPKPRLKVQSFEYDFSNLAIKGRASQGNILTKHAVRKITIKEEGVSTLEAIQLWYDDTVHRLNMEERGRYIGAFSADDKIVGILNDGTCRIYGYDVNIRFSEKLKYLFKHDPEKIYSLVYFNGEKGSYYLKRFAITPGDNDISLIGEHEASQLTLFMEDEAPRIALIHQPQENSRTAPYDEMVLATEFIEIKSTKAKGKRLTNHPLKDIIPLEPWKKRQEDAENLPPEQPASDEIKPQEEPSEPSPKEEAKGQISLF
ncbi:MAG: DNA topoisomerase IV [Bacteroidetes bacterium]|nr:MAG: DNA topoisomerase IV [Bacteroidota bacterium]